MTTVDGSDRSYSCQLLGYGDLIPGSFCCCHSNWQLVSNLSCQYGSAYIDGDYLSKLVRSTDFLAYSFRIPRCMKMQLLSLSNSCCHAFPFSSVGGCDGLLSPSRHWWRKKRACDGDYRLSSAIHLGQTTRDLGEGDRISRWLQGCSTDHHISGSVQEEVQEGHVEVLLGSPWPMVTVTPPMHPGHSKRDREDTLVFLFFFSLLFLLERSIHLCLLYAVFVHNRQDELCGGLWRGSIQAEVRRQYVYIPYTIAWNAKEMKYTNSRVPSQWYDLRFCGLESVSIVALWDLKHATTPSVRILEIEC